MNKNNISGKKNFPKKRIVIGIILVSFVGYMLLSVLLIFSVSKYLLSQPIVNVLENKYHIEFVVNDMGLETSGSLLPEVIWVLNVSPKDNPNITFRASKYNDSYLENYYGYDLEQKVQRSIQSDDYEVFFLRPLIEIDLDEEQEILKSDTLPTLDEITFQYVFDLLIFAENGLSKEIYAGYLLETYLAIEAIGLNEETIKAQVITDYDIDDFIKHDYTHNEQQLWKAVPTMKVVMPVNDNGAICETIEDVIWFQQFKPPHTYLYYKEEAINHYNVSKSKIIEHLEKRYDIEIKETNFEDYRVFDSSTVFKLIYTTKEYPNTEFTFEGTAGDEHTSVQEDNYVEQLYGTLYLPDLESHITSFQGEINSYELSVDTIHKNSDLSHNMIGEYRDMSEEDGIYRLEVNVDMTVDDVYDVALIDDWYGFLEAADQFGFKYMQIYFNVYSKADQKIYRYDCNGHFERFSSSADIYRGLSVNE